MRERLKNAIKKHPFIMGFILFWITQGKEVVMGAYGYLDSESVGEYYERNQDWLVCNSVFSDALHAIGWGLIKILKTILDLCEDLYKNSVGKLDFTTYTDLNDYIAAMKPLFICIVTISLIYMGYTMIICHEKKPNIIRSICLSAICLISLGTIMSVLNSAVINFVGDEIINGASSNDIILSDTYDILYNVNTNGTKWRKEKEIIDEETGKKIIDKNNVSAFNMDPTPKLELIDINEVINYDSNRVKDDYKKELLNKKVIDKKTGQEIMVEAQRKSEQEENDSTWYEDILTAGSASVDTSDLEQSKKLRDNIDKEFYIYREISDGYFGDSEKNGILNEFYYRYHVEYLPVLITLIAFIIVFICMTYKVIRTIYELAIKKLLAVLYSADLNGSQKTLKILSSIRDSYIIIMLSCILIKVFMFANSYLQDSCGDKPLMRCIFLVMIALAVVDGPDIIQQLTGIDAGLSGGFAKMMATYHIGKGIAKTATSPFRFGARIAGNRMHENRMANKFQKEHDNKKAVDNVVGTNDNNPKDMKMGDDKNPSSKENNDSNLNSMDKNPNSNKEMSQNSMGQNSNYENGNLQSNESNGYGNLQTNESNAYGMEYNNDSNSNLSNSLEGNGNLGQTRSSENRTNSINSINSSSNFYNTNSNHISSLSSSSLQDDNRRMSEDLARNNNLRR